MARLLRIERAIRWMAKSLTANRDALPFPQGMTDQINPVIDIFGSQRIAEHQQERVNGQLGVVEVTHGPVPADRIRFYLSNSYEHDDPVARRILPGRVIPNDLGFPFAAMRDGLLTNANISFAVRDFIVGPGAFAAARANLMGGGSRMIMTVVWVEMPLGEYVRGFN